MTERPCNGCNEPTLNPEWCRECDIERSLDAMQCSGCQRMRYRTETPFGDIGAYFWGEPCTCEPRPPSVLETKGGVW